MIAINELRIGNWFQQDASNNNAISRFFTVDEIKRYGVRSTYIRQDTNQPHTSLFSLDSIHPIPLTPEILEKCGFEKKQWTTKGIEITCYYYQLKNIVVYPLKGFFEIELITPSGQFNMFKSWNYLHQLQNLYFALTNSELTVDL